MVAGSTPVGEILLFCFVFAKPKTMLKANKAKQKLALCGDQTHASEETSALS